MIPISDILIRSISGYVFMVPVFVLYFLWLKKLGRTQSFLHTAREKKIVELRFGLHSEDGKEMTQKEVADLLGISQSYISRLEKKIIKRLKKEIVRFE